jgi:hypothetical protein
MRQIDQLPIGIILTMGQRVIDANGGLRNFIRHFTNCCRDENSGLWLQKSRNSPKQDIAFVYIVVANRLAYKVYYGGYTREPATVWMLNGEQRSFPWPHMILAGPIERAPRKIIMRGFQGFRYVYEPIF